MNRTANESGEGAGGRLGGGGVVVPADSHTADIEQRGTTLNSQHAYAYARQPSSRTESARVESDRSKVPPPPPRPAFCPAPAEGTPD